jgi:hypothetical protein
MAILATIFGLIGRFTGKLLTMSLGWASLLLFGRVPRDREVFLAAITFGSVIWVILIVGAIVPGAGAFLLAFAPLPDWVDQAWVQLGMLVAVVVLPPVLSATTLKLLRAEDRPKGMGPMLLHLARGYPLAAGLALLLVFLGVIGLARKVTSLAKRWSDTHIPIVVKPRGYEKLAADLDTAISDAGVDIAAHEAPAVMVVPGQLLARVAGTSMRGLVPDRLVRLVGRDVEVLIYPSDVAISGKPVTTARVQAALASRLTTTQAWLTMTAEGQAIEEQLAQLAGGRPDGAERGKALRSIDGHLATDELPYDEWEVLYRQRLQVERDLLVGRRPGDEIPAASGSAAPGSAASARATTGAMGWLRRDPIGTACAAGGLVLMALNAALLLLERRGTAPRP